MSETETYPFTAWRLMPSMKPVEVTLVSRGSFIGWHESEAGKQFHDIDLFPSKQAAIKEGFARIRQREAYLARLQETIFKRRRTLTKHQGHSLMIDICKP